MRIIIDIPEQEIQQLDQITVEEDVPRNELIKRGISMLLKTYTKPEIDGFGLWHNEGESVDGLAYQQNIRDEW
jgi:hypothetical protein